MNRTSRHNRHNHRRTGSYSKRQVRWASLIIVAVVLLGVIQMAGRVSSLIDMKAQVAEGEARLAEAQAVYEEKLATIELRDNPSYLERVARENLGMVKAGETIVAVVKSDADADADTASDSEEE